MLSGNVVEFRIVIFCSGIYSQVGIIQMWSMLSGSIEQISAVVFIVRWT